MRRTSSKKGTERRKRSRSVSRASSAATSSRKDASAANDKESDTPAARRATAPARGEARKKAPAPNRSDDFERRELKGKESCHSCGKGLGGDDRAVFVEEEVGRIFCSEGCITEYFGPEIERLEKDYFKRLAALGGEDLSGEERERLSHLRWVTLQEPDEVWREKTLAGDNRYYLISEFQPAREKVWCICICLFLRDEPSFLYLAIPTRNAALVDAYRRGERIQWTGTSQGAAAEQVKGLERAQAAAEATATANSDRLADAWTDDETMRAQLIQERSPDDIPAEEFSLYQGCLEETLEAPDEVWSLSPGGEESAEEGEEGESAGEEDSSEGAEAEGAAEEAGPKLYHFIRYYPEEKPGVWFLIIARETDDEEQIEILDAFPSRDLNLVNRYRRGELEVGSKSDEGSGSGGDRVIH